MVVITRPLAQCEPLAQRLRDAGREVAVFPLLEILPLEDQHAIRHALDRLEEFALVAFVSPNAIDAAFALRANWPQRLHIGVMGEGSRQALARNGINAGNAVIVSPTNRDRTDSETLLEQLDLPALRGRPVLIIRGESGRELLGDALRAAGARVEQVAAYRRSAPAFDEQRVEQLEKLIAADAQWVVTSSEALRNLVAMASSLQDHDAPVRLRRQRLIVPHIRIEETARLLGFEHIERSASGDEGLIATLQLAERKNCR